MISLHYGAIRIPEKVKNLLTTKRRLEVSFTVASKTFLVVTRLTCCFVLTRIRNARIHSLCENKLIEDITRWREDMNLFSSGKTKPFCIRLVGQVYNDMKNYADLGRWYPPRPGHPPAQPPFTM